VIKGIFIKREFIYRRNPVEGLAGSHSELPDSRWLSVTYINSSGQSVFRYGVVLV
jgi:hypothetical protein